MNVVNSSILMKSEPSDKSSLETECLFGETVEVLDEYLDWVYCKLNTDSYHGWVKKEGLGRIKNPTHRVIANRTFKSQFIFENLQIQNNIIHGSYKAGVKNLIFLGSSCIYPKFSKQPIKENYILTGALEQTNDAYAIAKICYIKDVKFRCFKYISDNADTDANDDWIENVSLGKKLFIERMKNFLIE